MTAPSPIRRESISYLPSQGINTKGLWLNRPLSDQEKKDIQTGVRCVFLYGRIEYVDVFKKKALEHLSTSLQELRLATLRRERRHELL